MPPPASDKPPPAREQKTSLLVKQAVAYLPHLLMHVMRTCSVASWPLLEQYVLQVAERINLSEVSGALKTELADVAVAGCIHTLPTVVSQCLAVMFHNSNDVTELSRTLFSTPSGQC